MKSLIYILTPIIIAVGLVVYNETHDNKLLAMLNGENKANYVVIDNEEFETDLTEKEITPKSTLVMEEDSTDVKKESHTKKTVVLENKDVINVTEDLIILSNNQFNILLGDIIVAGVLDKAPYGFSRKVIAINDQSNVIEIKTETASLEEALLNETVGADANDKNEETETSFEYTFQQSDRTQ